MHRSELNSLSVICAISVSFMVLQCWGLSGKAPSGDGRWGSLQEYSGTLWLQQYYDVVVPQDILSCFSGTILLMSVYRDKDDFVNYTTAGGN